MAAIYTDSINLKLTSDGSRATGLTLWLLPEGGTAPGDLIALTESAYNNGEYDFPVEVTNGTYTLYSGNAGSQVAVKKGGVTISVPVARSGIISAENTDFAY